MHSAKISNSWGWPAWLVAGCLRLIPFGLSRRGRLGTRLCRSFTAFPLAGLCNVLPELAQQRRRHVICSSGCLRSLVRP